MPIKYNTIPKCFISHNFYQALVQIILFKQKCKKMITEEEYRKQFNIGLENPFPLLP